MEQCTPICPQEGRIERIEERQDALDKKLDKILWSALGALGVTAMTFLTMLFNILLNHGR